MTAEQREMDEGEGVRDKLVQKLESYLRAHFDEKSAAATGCTMEMLLFGVARDWLLNRGMPPDGKLVKDAVNDAVSRYKSNWEGKEQGEDDRSKALGRALEPETKGYVL